MFGEHGGYSREDDREVFAKVIEEVIEEVTQEAIEETIEKVFETAVVSAVSKVAGERSCLRLRRPAVSFTTRKEMRRDRTRGRGR